MSQERGSEALSQNDIDRIMKGKPSAAPKVRRTDVQVYDFRRPNRISRERRRTLEAMYERLVRSLEGWLVARVRDRVELRVQSVEELTFGEFLLFLPTPCSSFLLDIKSAEGQAAGVVDFGRELGYFLVDRLFGGGGAPTILERALTPLERMALRSVADRVLSHVTEVWADHSPLEIAVTGFETIPEIMQGLAREDPVLVVNISASFAETRSILSICLPMGILEKFFVAATDRGNARVQGGTAENREITERTLRVTTVPVVARLPEFRLSMRDVLSLKVGSVLATGIPTDAPISLHVGSQPRFRSSAGRVGRKRAVRITESLIAPPSTPDHA